MLTCVNKFQKNTIRLFDLLHKPSAQDSRFTDAAANGEMAALKNCMEKNMGMSRSEGQIIFPLSFRSSPVSGGYYDVRALISCYTQLDIAMLHAGVRTQCSLASATQREVNV